MTDFAIGLQRPITTVSGWIRHESWRWAKRAPWSDEILPDVLRWAADELERGRPRLEKTDPGGVETVKSLREQKLRQEIRKLRANAAQAEASLAKERGALHDADECEEEAVRRATLYRNAVQNVPSQLLSHALSNGMPHESAAVFQKQVEEVLNGCLRFTAASADAQSQERDDEGASGAVAAGAVVAVAVG